MVPRRPALSCPFPGRQTAFRFTPPRAGRLHRRALSCPFPGRQRAYRFGPPTACRPRRPALSCPSRGRQPAFRFGPPTACRPHRRPGREAAQRRNLQLQAWHPRQPAGRPIKRRHRRPQARSERRLTACLIPRSCWRRSRPQREFLKRDGTACSIPRVPPTPARRRWQSKRMAEIRSGEDSVMAHTVRLLLTVAFLGGILALPETHAQAQAPRTASEAPTPATRPDIAQLVGDLPAPLPGSDVLAPETRWEPEFLRSLPRPPDQPRSLLQPAPPATPPPNLERYFVHDPILDPPQWPKTGWFTDVQIDIIHPHVFGNQWKVPDVMTSAGRSVNVATGVARLDWTVAPRLELGYRLPSGFGEFSVSDRGYYTDGSGPFSGPAGNFTRTSHLGVNYTDMDYASREYTQWPNWTMKWRAGVRVAYTWLDSTVSQPFNVAAAGNGVFADRAVNYTAGAGPHFGILLDHKLEQPG